MQTMEKDNNVGLNSFLETLNTAYAFTWKVMSDDCIIYKKKDWLIRIMNNFSSFFSDEFLRNIQSWTGTEIHNVGFINAHCRNEC